MSPQVSGCLLRAEGVFAVGGRVVCCELRRNMIFDNPTTSPYGYSSFPKEENFRTTFQKEGN